MFFLFYGVIIMDDNCIFCRIVKGDVPSAKVFEDDFIMAFLDIAPANKGHVLVIPKEHHETLVDIPENTLQKVVSATKRISEAVVAATEAKGFNVLNNNKPVSGQVVGHVHFHIIPRFEDDGWKLSLPSKKYGEGEMEKYRKDIEENCKC